MTDRSTPDGPPLRRPPTATTTGTTTGTTTATDPPRATATLPPPSTAPAGWYRDPFGYPLQRYFDGRGWTAHTAPLVAPRPAPHPVLPLHVAVVALAILTVSLIAGRLVLDAIVDTGWPIVVYVAINVAIGYGPSVWWCWYAAGRWGTGDRWGTLGMRLTASDVGWGPVVWLAAIGGEIVIASIIIATGIPLTNNTEGLRDLDLDRTYVISLLVSAVIAAPIVEEAVFRGLVLRGFLSRMPWVAAVLLQGLLFGLAHVDPERGMGNIGLALVLAAVGVVFGGAAYLLRRIGPTIFAHAILNGVVMAIVLTR
jgi:membrane protease YdiL (CAAX protease family)